MIDILKQHFVFVAVILTVAFLFLVTLGVALFRTLMRNPDGARRALRTELAFILGLRRAVKDGEAPAATDPLAQTISQPVKAPAYVPPAPQQPADKP